MRRSMVTAGFALGLCVLSPTRLPAQSWLRTPGRSQSHLRKAAPLPLPPVQTTPFDAKVKTVSRVAPPSSTMPPPGVRLDSRSDRRMGTRVGGSYAQRLGGGPDRATEPTTDPRDRLESKRSSYDTPR